MVVKPFLRHAKTYYWGYDVDHEDLKALGAKLLDESVKKARRATERVCLLLFADNFWLLAPSLKQLRAMTTKWHELLNAAGFGVNLSEESWTTTLDPKELHDTPLVVPNLWPELLPTVQCQSAASYRIQFVPRDVPIKILGGLVAWNGDCTSEVENRITRAWASFYKHRGLLTCKAVSLRKRMHVLNRFVLPALLYNIGVLTLTEKHLRRIRATENAMLRKLLRWKMVPTGLDDEDMAQ